MSCNLTSTVLAPNQTFENFEALNETCPTTYIRPDPGGSMMPWFFVLLLLFLHLPTCVIRAVQWESAQYLAMGLAVLGIALTVQAYVSTGLAASEILVWMPITLILDIGAMLQMVVLIIEKHDQRWRRWRKHPEGDEPPRGWKVLWDAIIKLLKDTKALMIRKLRLGRRRRDENARNDFEMRNNEANYEDEDEDLYPNALHYALVALVSLILLIMLVILQGYGLYAAVLGRRVKDMSVNWCSPAFRDFAVAVTTGNCDIYQVKESSSNGIGCISIPADQQRDWLLGTVIAITAALICQVLDTILMLFSHADWRPRGVRAQRPWFTMFGGCTTLIVLIAFGIQNANNLPKGVTETVWIYRREPSRAMGRVCRGTLNPPGLRGVIIGYMDGLLESWGATYHGYR